VVLLALPWLILGALYVVLVGLAIVAAIALTFTGRAMVALVCWGAAAWLMGAPLLLCLVAAGVLLSISPGMHEHPLHSIEFGAWIRLAYMITLPLFLVPLILVARSAPRSGQRQPKPRPAV